ncbi:MAG: hypothetical protein F4174_05285 [Acidobacteria bacterium]|nr:hypothetical protein [Acidobacteriota bacterium]
MPRLCLTLLLIGPFGACGGEPAAPEPESPAPDVSAAEELIARSIGYHDPAGLWDSGEIALRIMESRPNGVTRTVEVGIAPGSGAVEVRRETDAAAVSFAVSGEEILRRAVDGDEELDEPALGEHGLDAERVMWLRNYYLFVWGLPMKLRDPGTIVDPEPMMDSYNGQAALKVRVTYDPEVGGDTWYFYFHPETARMIGYRFYHDESANDGEYIHLEGEIVSGGLRLPAKRSWFFHSNEEFLGEDEAVSLTVTP